MRRPMRLEPVLLEAADAAEEQLVILRRHLGDSHPEVAEALAYLAGYLETLEGRERVEARPASSANPEESEV